MRRAMRSCHAIANGFGCATIRLRVLIAANGARVRDPLKFDIVRDSSQRLLHMCAGSLQCKAKCGTGSFMPQVSFYFAQCDRVFRVLQICKPYCFLLFGKDLFSRTDQTHACEIVRGGAYQNQVWGGAG